MSDIPMMPMSNLRNLANKFKTASELHASIGYMLLFERERRIVDSIAAKRDYGE